MHRGYHLFFIFLICFCLYGKFAFAQIGSGNETISTAQGLSQGLINDMIQDKEGFIWIATKGGLNRYDGYTFKIFTNDPQDTTSISSNAVSNLLEDSKGRIWIGTYDRGVNVYNKKTGRFLRLAKKSGDSSGLSSNRIVSAMLELPDGRILVCPQGGSMNIISMPDMSMSPPSITQVYAPQNREILGVEKDDKGFIWVGCTDGSIFIFNPSSFSFELLSNGYTLTDLIEKVGTQLTERASQPFLLKPFPEIPKSGMALIDSTGQLSPGVFSDDTAGGLVLNNRFPLKPGTSGDIFFDFSGLKAGNDLNDVTILYLKSSVKNQGLKSLLLDRSGILWVGTLGHGIYKYGVGRNRFNPLLPKWSLQRLTVLNKDIIYVQGWRETQTVTANGAEYANPLQPVVGNSARTVVRQAQNGDYWTYSFDAKKISHYTGGLQLLATYDEPVNPTRTEQLQPMIEDSKGRIWVCGANGTLARIDPTGKITRFVIDVEQNTGTQALAQTNAFYEDGQGIFWLGTEHGFAKLNFKNDATAPEVKWYKNIPGNTNSLSYNYVSWFMDDPVNADYLWICTKGGGLNRMEKSTGKFIHYTTKQGLPNDVVYGVLTDKADNIWGSTNKGLFCMMARQKDEQPMFRVFSTSDGLQADEFNTNAFAKLSNGNLAFGGINGINIFDPQKVLSSGFMPQIFITGIQIGNKALTPGDETGVLKETIEQTSAITLTHLQDVLTLEFSSLDFTAPLQNKYRYLLAGIDNDWVESGTRRTATYLHLPSGHYVFKVQGSNSQGMWSTTIAELKIVVTPPWWRTWWAYVVYALLIGFVLRAYFLFRINKAKLQSQLHFQQQEAKRARELDTLKTQLYANITHEFRTPLTVIMGMAQQVKSNPEEHLDNGMNMIVRNGQHLLDLVNEMLDLSKLEDGKMTLHLINGDVINFLRYIVESFQSLAAGQQKQFHFLSDTDELTVAYDAEKLRQIITNLLSNALKFTAAKGNVYVSISQEEAADADHAILVLKVKDTGIGIPENQIQHIFDRFYQLDNSHTRKAEGTGIGLALTKELVKLMSGTIVVKSPPVGATKGTEFIITLPLTKVHGVTENLTTASANGKGVVATLQTEAIEYTDSHPTKDKSAPLLLLVEDNVDVVAYAASCLPDYKLSVGKDGREGFDIAVEIIPDLIITDVMMPFIDGFEMCRKLRQDERTSHIPIIMLTAKADIQSKLEGLEKGADVYLEKPFNKEELLLRIRKLIELRKNLQQYYGKQIGIIAETDTMPSSGLPDVEEGKEHEFVKKVREIVEANFTNYEFSVEQLCRQVFMSHSQLYRKLEALTNCSPNKFIKLVRLQKAKTLLANPALPIGVIALECGYIDPGYFARVFKQEYGLTPQEWRAGQQKNHAH